MNKNICFLLYIFWMGSIGFSLGGVSILFYFRYRIICLNKDFPIKLQLICLLFAAMTASLLPLSYYYYYYYMDVEKLKISEELAPYFGKEDGKVDAVCIINTVG